MRIYRVHEVARYLNDLLRIDPVLSDLWVRGEVTNLSLSPAGHFYFSLKDDSSQLRCVIWRSTAARILARPEAGLAMVAHGSLGFYEGGGLCQLYVDQLLPEGLGEFKLQYEALKLKLEQEGLFAPERKRPLPPFPRRVGVITSEAGAVIHDILNILGRRYPIAEVVFVPCSVQGERAPDELVAALRMLNDQPVAIDVVVLARGGGSEEELSVFNDERLARAIYASRIPVVSAIGHETDYTIADLVADLRAPTPSAAAEMVAPDLQRYREDLEMLARRAWEAVVRVLGQKRGSIDNIRGRLVRVSPVVQIGQAREAVEALRFRCLSATRLHLERLRQQVDSCALQLRALNPLATLERGYSICYSPRLGRVITSSQQVHVGDHLEISLSHGQLRGTVEEALGSGAREAAWARSGRRGADGL